MTLRLHDTLTRRLQDVEPLEPGHVRLYTCGPTVWNRAHIGNFRTFLFEDVLRRWLERRFARVTHVMNLTDVDDRLIRNANEHGRGLDEETAPWIEGFFADVDTLGIRPAHHYPRATAYVPEMVALIERLEAAGVTYRGEGGVYFRIAGFPRYGALSGIPAAGLVAGGAAVSTPTTMPRRTRATSPSGSRSDRGRSGGTRAWGGAGPAGTSSARR